MIIMDKDRIILLICSVFNNRATDSEKNELNRWIDEDLKNKMFFYNFQSPEFIEKELNHYKKFDSQEQWSVIESRIKVRERKETLRKIVKLGSSIAAAVVAVSFIVYYLTSHNVVDDKITTVYPEKPTTQPIIISNGKITTISNDLNEIVIDNIKVKNNNSKLSYSGVNDTLKSIENTIVVPNMCTYSVQLSDSSIVTLNANSEMTYLTKFEGKTRNVKIKGEVYFEIAKSDKPFIVSVNGVEIKVYGTKFNVNCNVKNEIRAALLSGKISIKSAGSDEIMLKPGEVATVDIKGNTINITEFDAIKTVAWMDHCFYNDQDSVGLLLSNMEIWYGVEFDYDERLFSNTKITATYNRDLSIENILESLTKILNIKFIKTDENRYEIVKND